MNICFKIFVILWIILFLFVFSLKINNANIENFENKKENDLFLWSKRATNLSSYNLLDTETISAKDVVKREIKNSKDIVWIRNTSKNNEYTTDLDHFSSLLNELDKPIILITSDGDRSVPSSYNEKMVSKILDSPKILKWYTQNYDKTITHPKLSYYPIGLDMHTEKFLDYPQNNITKLSYYRNKKFNLFLKIRKAFNNKKKNKIFCDSHLSVSHSRRKQMHNILKNNKLIDFQNKRVSNKQILKKYAQYKFVLSPRGNGLDCHRTWEVLLLGSIVITETSSLDDMYIKNNLPVIIVNNYNELNNKSFKELDIWWNKNKSKCEKENILPKFKPSYWYNL